MENIYKQHDDCQIPGLQEIYAGVFGLIKDGTFCEVGAYDGVSWSNTTFLVKLGWKGLYVEPIEELAKLCLQNYHYTNNVRVANIAAGAQDDQELYFKHNTDAPWLYTANEDYGKLNGVNQDVGLIRTKKLDNILTDAGFNKGFELLVIDVEGMELEVLTGFNCMYWMPKLVIIETHELNPNSDMAKHAGDICSYFISANYIKIYTSGINTIFLRK